MGPDEASATLGVEVILVLLPMPDRYVALHPNGAADVARAHEAIELLGDELDVAVFDLTVGFDDDDFVDFTHLGPEGAAQLTRDLGSALSTR